MLVLDCAWNFNELVRQLYTFLADPEKEWGIRCHYESGGMTTVHTFREALTNRGYAGSAGLTSIADAYGAVVRTVIPRKSHTVGDQTTAPTILQQKKNTQ